MSGASGESSKQKQLTTQVETLANFALAAANRGDYPQTAAHLQEKVSELRALKQSIREMSASMECRPLTST
jgi:alkylhydroperoxidase/carboxymuconolactone decarboxylase family protein YurZ